MISVSHDQCFREGNRGSHGIKPEDTTSIFGGYEGGALREKGKERWRLKTWVLVFLIKDIKFLSDGHHWDS